MRPGKRPAGDATQKGASESAATVAAAGTNQKASAGGSDAVHDVHREKQRRKYLSPHLDRADPHKLIEKHMSSMSLDALLSDEGCDAPAPGPTGPSPRFSASATLEEDLTLTALESLPKPQEVAVGLTGSAGQSDSSDSGDAGDGDAGVAGGVAEPSDHAMIPIVVSDTDAGIGDIGHTDFLRTMAIIPEKQSPSHRAVTPFTLRDGITADITQGRDRGLPPTVGRARSARARSARAAALASSSQSPLGSCRGKSGSPQSVTTPAVRPKRKGGRRASNGGTSPLPRSLPLSQKRNMTARLQKGKRSRSTGSPRTSGGYAGGGGAGAGGAGAGGGSPMAIDRTVRSTTPNSGVGRDPILSPNTLAVTTNLLALRGGPVEPPPSLLQGLAPTQKGIVSKPTPRRRDHGPSTVSDRVGMVVDSGVGGVGGTVAKRARGTT